MRILIAASVSGPNSYEEALAKELNVCLKKMEYTVDYFLLPYKDNILLLPDQILAYRMLDMSVADMLITIGYPACFLKHPNKCIYLLETAPAIHEYWDSEYGVLGNYQYSQILISINQLEKEEFSSSRKILCASKLLANDLETRYRIKSDCLYFPNTYLLSWTGSLLIQEDWQDEYYICETCLPQYSRVLPFLEQMKQSGCHEKLFLYIPDSSRIYYSALKKLLGRLELEKQVVVVDGRPKDEVVAKAKASLFFAFNARRPEDLLRRCATLEASVIVAEDSGFAAEICGNASAVSFSKICHSMQHGECIKSIYPMNDIETFARGIIKYEDSII